MKLESESFDEKEFLKSELSSIGKKEFGVDVEVYSESDEISMILKEKLDMLDHSSLQF